jgi:hypothetical protein
MHMLTLLSFAMFSAILLFSLATIVAGVRSELPLILGAFGIEPVSSVPPLQPEGERRVRVIKQARLGSARSADLRAAA